MTSNCVLDAKDVLKDFTYGRHNRQGRLSLAWDNKPLTLLCLLEQPVFQLFTLLLP